MERRSRGACAGYGVVCDEQIAGDTRARFVFASADGQPPSGRVWIDSTGFGASAPAIVWDGWAVNWCKKASPDPGRRRESAGSFAPGDGALTPDRDAGIAALAATCS